jgi:CRISPR-associated endoribonuclease Cas6
MSAFPDLYAFVLRLHPVGGATPRPQGQGAQALFLDLLAQVAPAVASELHADAQSKPYTVAIVPNPRRDLVELRVSLLRSDLFQPFVQALLNQMPGPAPLRLGRAALQLGDVIGTPLPQGHSWAGYGSFAELYARAVPAHSITLEFATATAIGQGTRPGGKQRLALLPTPELIFKSLAKRWNELAPTGTLDLALVQAAADDTLVTRYRAESTEIDLGKGPQKGFTGLVTYELPTDQEQARVLALLADAALFLGVGMKTARGMGLCRRT